MISQRLARLMELERLKYAHIERLHTNLRDEERLYRDIQIEIAKLLNQESTAAPISSGDSRRPAARAMQSGRGFQLVAHTRRGEEAIAELTLRLPSGDL